jgi:ankyrin repeat protein
MLVDAGADVDKCRVLGQEALKWSVSNANDETLQILSRASRKNWPPMIHDGILKAAVLGSRELSEYLGEKGEDVNSSAREILRSALCRAIDEGHYFVVKSLLEIGVDSNADCEIGNAITIVVSRNDIQLIEILLDAGADVNVSGVLEILDLSDDNLELIRILLDEGVDINTHGGKAFQNAVSCYNLEAVQLLLISGADVNAPADKIGNQTALQAAINRSYSGALKRAEFV